MLTIVTEQRAEAKPAEGARAASREAEPGALVPQGRRGQGPRGRGAGAGATLLALPRSARLLRDNAEKGAVSALLVMPDLIVHKVSYFEVVKATPFSAPLPLTNRCLGFSMTSY